MELDPRHVEMVKVARAAGAGVNYTGSGSGAVVCVCEDPAHRTVVAQALRVADCRDGRTSECSWWGVLAPTCRAGSALTSLLAGASCAAATIPRHGGARTRAPRGVSRHLSTRDCASRVSG